MTHNQNTDVDVLREITLSLTVEIYSANMYKLCNYI